MTNRQRKLDARTVQAIRAYHRLGYTCRSVATAFGVGTATVKDALTRRTWVDVPDVDQPPAGLRRVVSLLRRRRFKRKLTPEMVTRIRAMARQGRSQRYIARVVGSSQPNICYVLRGVIHRDVPDVATPAKLRRQDVRRPRQNIRAA